MLRLGVFIGTNFSSLFIYVFLFFLLFIINIDDDYIMLSFFYIYFGPLNICKSSSRLGPGCDNNNDHDDDVILYPCFFIWCVHKIFNVIIIFPYLCRTTRNLANVNRDINFFGVNDFLKGTNMNFIFLKQKKGPLSVRE